MDPIEDESMAEAGDAASLPAPRSKRPHGNPPGPISLSDRERLIQIRNDESQQKIQLRREFTKSIKILFCIQTLFLLILLGTFGFCDFYFSEKVLSLNPSAQMYESVTKNRFITPGVIMALIAATVTEVAAAVAALTYYLFGARGKNHDHEL